MRIIPALSAACLSLFAISCASTPTQTAAVTGTVTYRERISLPEPTVVIVLQDTSRADAPAVQIAKQTIVDERNPPFAFKLNYDPAKIDQTHTYSVSARVYSRGDLHFVTDTSAPVLTKGAGSTADIVVVAAK